MRPSSFLTRIAGERKLPGGRVALLPLLLALIACGSPSATSAATTAAAGTPAATAAAGAPAQSAAPSPSTFPAIPTLGGPAATGVVLTSYFVTVTESRYGLVSAVTTPGSSCTAEAAMPDGTQRSSDTLRTARTADPSGRVAFEYPAPSAAAGVGTHTVSCELAGQRQQARARFDVK